MAFHSEPRTGARRRTDLSDVEGHFVEAAGGLATALVGRDLAVLVGDRNERARLDQLLGHVHVAPEAGVVQRRVAVLVDEVDVAAVLQQQPHDVQVAVRRRQVQWRVVAHVGRAHPGSPLDKLRNE